MAFVTKRIRLLVPANKAKPSPSIGQALGSVGINMMKFCKDFNAASTAFIDELPLRCQLQIMNDGSYSFTLALPQSSFFIKRMVGLQTLAHKPGHEVVGSVHCKQLYELAQLKVKAGAGTHIGGLPVRSVYKSLLASCRSYGVDVSFEREQEREQRIAAEEEQKKKLAAGKERKGGKRRRK